MSSVALLSSSSISNHPEIGGIDKPAAQALFCGLGEEWWKQVIDGKYHRFGPMVFDQGLHIKNRSEPGFYGSLIEALNFTKEHLCEPLTVDFYCKLHKKACAHFKGKANNTDMEWYSTGQFRGRTEEPVTTTFGVEAMMGFILRNDTSYDNKERLIKDFQQIKTYINNNRSIETLIADLKEDGCVKIITFDQYNQFESLFRAKYAEFEAYIKTLDHNILPHFKLDDNVLRLSYSRNDLHHFVEIVISDYKEAIARAATDDKKLEAIADVYQKLEWLHPFRDGQGRTDLVILSKLLSENGFNPPILMEPYVSSYVPLKEWVNYLKEGIQKWKDLKSCSE